MKNKRNPDSSTNRIEKSTVIQPGYMPWLGYFDLLVRSDVFIVYDDVQFDRGGWRNRNRILNNNNRQWLTVPVQKKNYAFAPIRDIRIHGNAWQRKHLTALRSCYGKAPYFDWCYPAIEAVISGYQGQWLLELCLLLHQVIANLFSLRGTYLLASEIGFSGTGKNQRLVELCRCVGAKIYIATNASSVYLETDKFESAGIRVVYQNYEHPVYPQFGDTFISHLSAVDALMFLGLRAAGLIGDAPRNHTPAFRIHPNAHETIQADAPG